MASLRCTIVVIAMHGGRSLEACLNALAAQGAACMAMLGEGSGDAALWRARFPAVQFIDAAALPVPRRRMRGVAAADTELVALLEDSSIPQARWSTAIIEAFAAPAVAAVGGPVTIGAGVTHRQQALACCEYGRFHPASLDRLAPDSKRERSGPFDVDRLPGNNLAYRKAALQAVAAEEGVLIETQVNAALRAAGGRLQIHPGMAVEYRPDGDRGTRLRERYRHGRLYGGMRAQGASAVRRMGWLLKACLLPCILSGRSLRAMSAMVRPAAWLPVGGWVCGMETAWAVGEAVGYVAGPGQTLEAWH